MVPEAVLAKNPQRVQANQGGAVPSPVLACTDALLAGRK